MTGNKSLIFCFEDFYPSNIPYNHILKDIIEECCRRGEYSVEVITSFKPDPKEQSQMLNFFEANNIESAQFKSMNKFKSIFFSMRVFFYLLRHGKGTVIVPSSPPVIMGFSVFLAKYLGGSRFNYIYHCQDIHPEALVISNHIKNTLLVNIMKYMDNFTLSYAKNIIVLSEDMQITLEKRKNKPLNNLSIINNFIPSAYSSSLSLQSESKTIRSNHKKDDIIFVFAGNTGAFQNLEMLLEGFLNLDLNEHCHLYFVGEGKVKNILIQQSLNHSSKMKVNVHFLDKMDSQDITHFISEADYGIVSISDELLDVAYPSKIATYLSLGLPLLLCGGVLSKIEDEVNNESLGVSISGKNVDTIKKGFEDAIQRCDFFKSRHADIKNYYNLSYDRKKIISNIIETF